ncbi:MAG: SPOR domain-containing protein [Bacteroidales bacterium]|nr:SPOR domain-containing protein [Bacteroidales bacterium]
MKGLILRLLLFAVIQWILVGLASAQDNNKLEQRPWSFNANFGQTLFWGDGNNEITNPFSAYFQNDKSAFGYGLIVQKNFNSWLGIDFQYLGGQLKGTRYTWSDDAAANLYFKTAMHQFGLNLDIDVFDIFMEPTNPRLFNFYIRGGGAYNLYNAVEYDLLTNKEVKKANSGAIVVDGGWGIRFDLNKKVGITFENIFVYSFDDFLDAHSTQYSQANDLFAYTSLGVTYRMYPQPKKPRLNKEIDQTDSDIVAQKTEDSDKEDPKTESPEKPKELEVAVIVPGSIEPTDTTIISIKLNKYDLKENAKLQQTLPIGFKAVENKNAGAIFNFSDQIVSFTWSELDASKEVIELSYFLISDNKDEGTYNLSGIVFYTKNGAEIIKQFKQPVKVIAPAPVVAETAPVNTEEDKSNNEQSNTNNQTTTSKTQPTPTTPVKTEENKAPSTTVSDAPTVSTQGVVYRVQIKAIYGGKSSAPSISRQYGISEPVKEEFVNGYAKYTAGNFSTYQEAQAYKDQLRNGSVPGAFVVAYINDRRVDNINEALSYSPKNISSKPITSNTQISQPGMSYSIQIAASSRELSAIALKNQFNLSETVTKTTHNGLYKYMVGSYTNKVDADAALQVVKQRVADAFIVTYKNGIRQ